MHQWGADRRPPYRRYLRVWVPAALCAIVVAALIPIIIHVKSSAARISAATTMVSLDFDGDLASQYYLGFQHALQPAGVHATFYVDSSTIGAAGKLSWPQVSSLAAAGDEIGGTADGAKLTSLTAAQRANAICTGRQDIVSHGIKPAAFAYPAGDASSAIQAEVQNCGYGNARTAGSLSPAGPVYAETLPPENWLALRAYAPNGQVTLASLKSLVSGAAARVSWIPVSIQRVCSAALDKANYRSCTATAGWIDLGDLQDFISWVQNAGHSGSAPPGTVFRTMEATARGADIVGPSTAISCYGAPCKSSTYDATVNVTLPSTDSGSGVASTHYSLDGTTPTQSSPAYTGPVPLVGTTTVRYRSWDSAGNAEAVRTTTILITTGQVDAQQIAGKTVVTFTFDDAYEDQWLYGVPLMHAHKFTGTYYVITKNPDDSIQCCMSWNQLEILLSQGNDIASHTITHPDNLTTLTPTQLKEEICGSRQDLISHGIPDPGSFAYPDGIYNSAVQAMVRQCGFASARQGGGISNSNITPGSPYAETIPPADPYALRTIAVDGAANEKLADLQSFVTAAAANGGGWLPITFHNVCDAKAADFRDCLSQYGSIQDTVFGQFLDWLAAAGQPGGAPASVIVKNVCQVMDCRLPPRRECGLASTVPMRRRPDRSRGGAHPSLGT
jgi:peptidoglycan/xylan/chitin deacetylase (PgdA/CDA1 family)